MSDTDDLPQVYLITPPEFELSTFTDRLAACLDAVPVACVRLGLASRDEDKISRAADALRDVTQTRDVALVIETHLKFVERHGLDGVHLTDAARSVKKARKDLGEDAIDLESLAERRSQSLGGNIVPMGLGDFFFNPGDPLHPDAEDDDDEEDEDFLGESDDGDMPF